MSDQPVRLLKDLDTETLVDEYNKTKAQRLQTGGHKKYDRLLARERMIEEELGYRATEDDEANPNVETFPEYLGRVGSDYRESGNEATAQDYEEAAERIEQGYADISAIRAFLTTEFKVEDIDAALAKIQKQLYAR